MPTLYLLFLVAGSVLTAGTPRRANQKYSGHLPVSIHSFNRTHSKNEDDGGCAKRCEENYPYEEYGTTEYYLNDACTQQCEYDKDYCEYVSLDKCYEAYQSYTSLSEDQWKATCRVSCSVPFPDGCLKRCKTNAEDENTEFYQYCREQCDYANYAYCRYTTVAYCKSGFNEDGDDDERAVWDQACGVSCSTTYQAQDDDEEDCIERCEDKVDDKLKPDCIGTCQESRGRCMYNSYSDCVDQYDSKDPIVPFGAARSSRANEQISIKDIYKEDEWKSLCKAICPRASVWWVALIVLLVVAIVVAVVLGVLLIICMKKNSSSSSNSA